MPRAAWGLAVFVAVTGAVSSALAQPRQSPRPAVRLRQRASLSAFHRPNHRRVRVARTNFHRFSARRCAPRIPEPEHRENVRVAGADRGDLPSSTGTGTVARFKPRPPGRGQLRRACDAPPRSAHRSMPATRFRRSAVEPAQQRNTPPAQRSRSAISSASDRRCASNRKRTPTSRPASSARRRRWCCLGHCDTWFKSDHVFDGFISPVTNPFLFEDPRSLTEVRPIFMYPAGAGRASRTSRAATSGSSARRRASRSPIASRSSSTSSAASR